MHHTNSRDVHNSGKWERGFFFFKFSVLTVQFFCEPKTAVKTLKSIHLKKNLHVVLIFVSPLTDFRKT